MQKNTGCRINKYRKILKNTCGRDKTNTKKAEKHMG